MLHRIYNRVLRMLAAALSFPLVVNVAELEVTEHSVSASDNQLACTARIAEPMSEKIRPDVKRSIDAIPGNLVSGPAHTTDEMLAPQANPEKRLPSEPVTFPAGRYKVIFETSGKRKALWIDTEQNVGHFTTTTPGQTRVVGSVQLSDDATAEIPSGPKLNQDEIDYLILALYRGFCSPLKKDTATQLNQIKDQLLTLRFSTRDAMQRYHLRLVRELK